MPRISALTLGALLLCILPPSHTFTGPSIFPLQTRTSRTTSALRMVEDATAGSAGRLVSGRRAAVQALAGAVVAGAAGATASSAQGRSFEQYIEGRNEMDKGRGEALRFEFDARQPLGLDLSEVRFSDGDPRVVVKGIQPGTQADAMRAQGLKTGLLLVGVNGNMVDVMPPSSAIRAVVDEKRGAGRDGLPLTLTLARGTTLQRFDMEQRAMKK